jgi:periplasmic copper chaperone A
MAMNIKRWKLTNAFGGACGRVLIIVSLTLILSLCGFASRVFAHVTLEQNQATIGTSYKAVLRVPHGCDGSATTAIRVRIPEGVLDVKPMPKPGWTVAIIRGKYSSTHSLHHAQVSEGVTEVDWSGGKLPDEYYDEFVFQSYLASDLEAGQMLYFPVVQECEKGVHKWVEVPTAGSNHPEPAPGLKLVPKP